MREFWHSRCSSYFRKCACLDFPFTSIQQFLWKLYDPSIALWCWNTIITAVFIVVKLCSHSHFYPGNNKSFRSINNFKDGPFWPSVIESIIKYYPKSYHVLPNKTTIRKLEWKNIVPLNYCRSSYESSRGDFILAEITSDISINVWHVHEYIIPVYMGIFSCIPFLY